LSAFRCHGAASLFLWRRCATAMVDTKEVESGLYHAFTVVFLARELLNCAFKHDLLYLGSRKVWAFFFK
jgi:hypothetical protein